MLAVTAFIGYTSNGFRLTRVQMKSVSVKAKYCKWHLVPESHI